jgi:anti-sigma-K factor RskA
MQPDYDLHRLTGAYAVDALDVLERDEFETHLHECTACAEEVAELQATAARLGDAVSVPPPARLRASVMDEVRRTRQEAPAVVVLPGSSRWTRTTVWLASAAAVFALVAGGSLGWSAHLRNDRDAAQASARSNDQVAAVLAAPDADLASGRVGSGTVKLVVSRQLNRAAVVASGLATAPSGHTYQLWLLTSDGRATSVGLMSPKGGERVSTLLAAPLTGESTFGITVEPTGGSASPTTRPVVLLSV